MYMKTSKFYIFSTQPVWGTYITLYYSGGFPRRPMYHCLPIIHIFILWKSMQSSNKTPKTPKKMTIILGDNATLYGNHGNNLANKPTSHWVRQVLNLLTIPHPTIPCTSSSCYQGLYLENVFQPAWQLQTDYRMADQSFYKAPCIAGFDRNS